jgi:signal transduction histidine kinase
MNPVGMTLMATASEPSELEARTHAIKNCVCVILGLASTLERHVDPVARPRVTHLVDAGRRLTTLLTGQTGPCDRVRKDVSISDVLGLVVDRLAPQAETCGVELAIECAGGGLHGDLAELAEALFNVGSNALDASPAGGTVRITTRMSPEGDHEWSVKDSGRGIPASVMTRLGRVGVTTRDDGMGLGLSLAVQTVTRHAGVMHVESVEGHGTTVIIWLPATLEGSRRT